MIVKNEQAALAKKKWVKIGIVAALKIDEMKFRLLKVTVFSSFFTIEVSLVS